MATSTKTTKTTNTKTAKTKATKATEATKAARSTKARKAPRKATTGRGSPEAVEKRRAARQLNALIEGGPGAKALDGRTENRRRRLIASLKGKGKRALKPIERVQKTHELLELGETFASLKKHGVKIQKADPSPELREVVARAQAAYGFRPAAWRILGLKVDAAGLLQKRPTKKRS